MTASVPAHDPVEAFEQACAEGRLVYQQCGHCDSVQVYPRTHCARCHHAELQWRRSSGRGTLLSHTTVHRAASPQFQQRTPYVLALVAVEEGFRLMINIDPLRPLAIGDAVEIGFVIDVDGRARLAGTVR